MTNDRKDGIGTRQVEIFYIDKKLEKFRYYKYCLPSDISVNTESKEVLLEFSLIDENAYQQKILTIVSE